MNMKTETKKGWNIGFILLFLLFMGYKKIGEVCN